MIIVCGGIKGGSGKTTAATNLAVIRARSGRDVLLCDADDQETATDFTNLRTEQSYTAIRLTGQAVRTQLLKLAPKYHDVVIDTGGRDTTSQRAALTVADVLLVPFVPRSFDLWTLDKVSSIVDEMRVVNPDLKAFTFLNRCDPRGQDNADTEEVLKGSTSLQFINTPLGSRKAFSNAAAAGLSVVELSPQDAKATAEVMALYDLIFDTENIPE